MAVDPTGFDAALATIPKGQLSERQMRIAAALAMMKDGTSLNDAARIAQVAKTTLWRYHCGLSSLTEPENKPEVDLEAIQAMSTDIAQIAGEAIRESLATDSQRWKPGDLVKAYGVAVDKIAVLGQRTAPQAAGMASLVSALLEQGELSFRKRDPMVDAIEVEAEEIG